jgi:hypothetical protein
MEAQIQITLNPYEAVIVVEAVAEYLRRKGGLEIVEPPAVVKSWVAHCLAHIDDNLSSKMIALAESTTPSVEELEEWPHH